MITIQELVQREILVCVSCLVYTLTQEGKLDDDLAYSLWQGPISYDDCEYTINEDGSYLGQRNGLWGLYDNDDEDNPIVDYEYETREALIDWYFDDMGWDINDYRQEVFEHWLVSSWLFKKLQEHGETVVELYGLNIWCRTTTGMAIAYDSVIKEIYSNLIHNSK